MRSTVDLFVPGRLCLFGEHSDWAGEHRIEDPSVEKGFCIIAGTDQGIHARAESAGRGFHISQVAGDGSMSAERSYEDSAEAERGAAEPDSFNAYAAGTASVIMRKHPGLGLRLKVYKRTLPLKKGLSSSAAVCVATARAFSMVHGLGYSVEEEMDAAYRGELLTGSRCGRMDQACACGRDPVLLTFDGGSMNMERLHAGNSMPMVIADLGGSKNTRRILADLNRCFLKGYPQIRKALGSENRRIVEEAREAMESGNSTELGRLMYEAQDVFDTLVAPCCPEELEAPKLHAVLEKGKRWGLALGGKGVGSQGDGTAQFLCRGEEERRLLSRKLEEIKGVRCYYLTVQNSSEEGKWSSSRKRTESS